jgi:hypothetical protein
MNAPMTTQQAQRPTALPDAWVRKLFAELHGNYGSRWLTMWATGEKLADGSDAGVAVAMRVWAEKLAGFSDKPEAIKGVLANLPIDVPSLPKFLELCREQARRVGNEAPKIAYTPTAEDLQRQREAAQKVAEAAQKKTHNFDPMRWCRKPGSQIAMDHIVEEARSRGNQVLAKVLDELIETGICTQAGKLLKRWELGAWVKP